MPKLTPGLLVLAIAFVAAPRAAFAATVVSSCGQTVFEGILSADLDCSSHAGIAVIIEDDGSLDLAGHTLVAGPAEPGVASGAVRCLKDCRVSGGSITSYKPYDWNEPATLTTAVFAEFGDRGRISMSDLVISGFHQAAGAYLLDIDGCTFLENNSGCIARKMQISNSTLTNPDPNGFSALFAWDLLMQDSFIQGGAGIQGRRFEIYRSTVTGMRDSGVSAFGNRRIKRLYAEDSVIDDNCNAMTSEYCGDILSTARLPELVNTVCSTSVRYYRRSQSWGSWGICSAD